MDAWKILKYPYMTEKSISLVEKENKIVFVVERKATKEQIKKAFEQTFEVKVAKINTETTLKGEKKAFIKLKPEFKAVDVATKLGLV
ncbi:MAG TPA: 50S ribosomal protein L23 [archaeon]|nr:50S ribosomal protein L23 [archaeon]